MTAVLTEWPVTTQTPCLYLRVRHEHRPGSGLREMRILTLLDPVSGKQVVVEKDMGPGRIDGVPINIPGGLPLGAGRWAIEHTVGELMALADELVATRTNDTYLELEGGDQTTELVTEYQNLQEEKAKWRSRQRRKGKTRRR